MVLGVASRWDLTTATTMALVATLLFNYFFLPPIHTFTISDPQNWIALLAFLASAIVASRLSERPGAEAQNATRRRKEVERLYALSQQLLSTENVIELNNSIPGFVCDAFGATSVAMYLPKRNQVYRAGIEHSELNDERLRAVSVRGEVLIDSEQRLSFVPLRIGVRPVGSLGILDSDLSRETLEAVGSLIAISIERAGAVETVTRAEAARESEKLRSALLDSVTHAFRTPLTSIKASVTTLLSSAQVDEAGRKDLLAVIDEEADRLNRLVGEAAEMSQLDAQQVELHLAPHAVSEVVEAGLARARPVLNRREIKIEIPAGLPAAQVDLDRTAEVIAHLLENAAKYSPPQSSHHHHRGIAECGRQHQRRRPGSRYRRLRAVADLREVLPGPRSTLPGRGHRHGLGDRPRHHRSPRRDDRRDFTAGQRLGISLHDSAAASAGCHRGLISAFFIDSPQQRVARQVATKIVAVEVVMPLPHLVGVTGQVGCDQNILQRPQWRLGR